MLEPLTWRATRVAFEDLLHDLDVENVSIL